MEEKTFRKLRGLRNKSIYNPDVLEGNTKNKQLEILRIRATEEYTIIDFFYHASKIYDNGGWVQISGDSFIRRSNGGEKLKLIKAVNIPIAPNKHYFKSQNDTLAYTLYFPALPSGTLLFDIIEFEPNLCGNFFNFYSVSFIRLFNPIKINSN